MLRFHLIVERNSLPENNQILYYKTFYGKKSAISLIIRLKYNSNTIQSLN